MIDIDDTGDAELFAVAFNHKTNHTLTVVLLNVGTASKQVTLAGAALPPTLECYVSTQSKHCAAQSDVNSNGSFTAEAGSITTLVGSSYSPVGVRRAPSAADAGSPGLRTQGSVVWYSLDGRAALPGRPDATRTPHRVVVRRTHGQEARGTIAVR